LQAGSADAVACLSAPGMPSFCLVASAAFSCKICFLIWHASNYGDNVISYKKKAVEATKQKEENIRGGK
jgi:hypothetical protein